CGAPVPGNDRQSHSGRAERYCRADWRAERVLGCASSNSATRCPPGKAPCRSATRRRSVPRRKCQTGHRQVVPSPALAPCALVGTPEYMAPEQAKGQPVDVQSDIYGAGLIFYELLTGKVPYPADSALQSLMKRTQERALPASQLDNSVPRVLSVIVGRCLELEPRNRYQNAAELLADLEAYQPSGAQSSTRVLGGPSVAVPRLYKRLTIVLATVLVVTAGVVAGRRLFKAPIGPHAPVSVLVSDFENKTGEPLFDGTLEPAFTVALEGAPFITSYNRDQAHKLATRLQPGATVLSEQLARLVATREGIGTVVTGSIMRDGGTYRVSVKAEDGVTGKAFSNRSQRADKTDVVAAV